MNLLIVCFVAKVHAQLDAGIDKEEQIRLGIEAHNYLRSLHGVQPLTRNVTLDGEAQQQSEYMAQTGIMEHALDLGGKVRHSKPCLDNHIKTRSKAKTCTTYAA